MSKLLFLLFASVAASSLSCANQESCDAQPIRSSAFTSRILEGSLTLTGDSGVEEPFVIGKGCNTTFVLERSQADTDALLQAPAAHVLQCISNGRSLALDLALLADARTLTVGQRTWSGTDLGLALRAPVNHCEVNLGAGTVTASVSEAKGGSMPYPQIITSDYVRRYTLHIEITDPANTCGSVSVVADLEVEQTASDVVPYETEVGCL